MRSLVVALTLILLATGTISAQAFQFQLGFKALADQIPSIAGQPIESEHYGPNGDSLQQTTTGLMAWRKIDNKTVFTNGARTWVAGPFGVMERSNDERFDWEPMPRIGERIAKSGLAITVNSLNFVPQSPDRQSKAKAGNIYFLIDVTIENLDLPVFEASPFFFHAAAPDGYRYPETYYSGAKSLIATLRPGEKVRGQLAFEIPQGTEGVVLLSEPSMSGPDRSMKFALN